MASLMGGVSRRTYASTFPPDRYYCLLDDLPLHLVPQRFRATLTRPDVQGDLFLNPDCTFRSASDLPTEFAQDEDVAAAFALSGTIAWVRDAGCRSLLPFWLGPDFEEIVRGLRVDEPVSLSLPEDIRSILHAARILVSERNQPAHSGAILDAARVMFKERGYAPLSELIHPFHVAALRRYYRYLVRNGRISLGDAQSSLRYAIHNEPVARFFHRQLSSMLSAVVGEPVKPSYVYLASYLGGAELKKHVDREQCEFSITFCLDFSPEPELATPWPIRLDSANGAVTVYQALGDGLVYRGTQLPHYRHRLKDGQTSTSIFFHYVSEDFNGSLK
jgi:hypothetical protein